MDIDGTLIDSNDAHAKAWVEAFSEQGLQVDYLVVRRKIGMGGDHLLPEVTSWSEDSPQGKKVSERRGQIFREKYLPTLKPFPGARALLERFLAEAIELVVATSASEEDMQGVLEQAGLDDLLKKKTNADDAERSKPSPDIITAALKKIKFSKEEVLMVGDTPYDVEAADKAGVRAVAFTCGGWSKEDLAPAIAIFKGPQDLLDHFHLSPFNNPN